ncbi:recombinase family protein [Caulifigura coniformis]|uniref:recombinase family protein n=1 Tax=Caulifigura coniformis TaxID=2527983 RepID=UPI0018D21F46|nr:recombinase family protein [Caulifigura coniformis]
MTTAVGKEWDVAKLRFGALIRVSTEKQEKLGESLRTQRADAERNVKDMGGTVAGWYGGQEHATPGFEKKELDRLILDATKGRFDAVIVAHADRWSRDNVKSKEGLQVLKKHRVRFFVGKFEYDLFNPTHQFFLGMTAEIGQLHASTQNQKSIENRIARAKRGLPTTGKLPYGRTFDRKSEKWGIDKEKQKVIAEAARRYLDGASMADLAKKYGMNHSNLHKVLMQRCGPEWEMEFTAPEFNIHEKVIVQIPQLLDAKTIKALKKRASANKTYLHQAANDRYLLSGFVFCEQCGYTLFGQTNHNGHRYYRHSRKDGALNCAYDPRPWVRADELEKAVVESLFRTFGNPVAVEKAIEEATPNLDKVRKVQQQIVEIDEDLKKIATGRDKVLDLVVNDAISDHDGQEKLRDLKSREARLKEERERLCTSIGSLPSADAVRDAAKRIAASFNDGYPTASESRMMHKITLANFDVERMSVEDRRSLVRSTFDGTLANGRPMGVYITAVEGEQDHRRKQWQFTLKGHVVDGITAVARRAYH